MARQEMESLDPAKVSFLRRFGPNRAMSDHDVTALLGCRQLRLPLTSEVNSATTVSFTAGGSDELGTANSLVQGVEGGSEGASMGR